jgi:hypothetical protein
MSNLRQTNPAVERTAFDCQSGLQTAGVGRRSLRWGVFVLVSTALQSACTPAFKSPSLSEVRYVPGKTTAAELVAQAGLPSRVEAADKGDAPFKRFIYLKGSDAVYILVPIAVPVGNNTYLGAVVKDEYSTYKPTADVAFACLISKDGIVVSCVAGDR